MLLVLVLAALRFAAHKPDKISYNKIQISRYSQDKFIVFGAEFSRGVLKPKTAVLIS